MSSEKAEHDSDPTLDMVDRWKFAVYEDIKDMTPEQRAAFWEKGGELARKLGLPMKKGKLATQPKKKRRPRKTA